MIVIPADAFSTFQQCGHKYRLTQIDGVPYFPTTRMLVSRIVRAAIAAELRSGEIEESVDQRRQRTRQMVESLCQQHFTSEVSLTDAEVQRGQRSVFEGMLKKSLELFCLWRAVVRARIQHTHLDRPYELAIGGATITGRIEIQESEQIRATKVRARRPAEGETDFRLVFAAIAAGVAGAEVTYLIDGGKDLAVDRQYLQVTEALVEAVKMRVNALSVAVSAEVFLPAEPSNWRCRSCQLRPVCHYVE